MARSNFLSSPAPEDVLRMSGFQEIRWEPPGSRSDLTATREGKTWFIEVRLRNPGTYSSDRFFLPKEKVADLKETGSGLVLLLRGSDFRLVDINQVDQTSLRGEVIGLSINQPRESKNCFRCGHEWRLRGSTQPEVCPKCRSPYWDRPRRSKTRPTA